ncbi:MAG: LysR family transcriptional regulator [Hyphomicrobiaceae bacterium]
MDTRKLDLNLLVTLEALLIERNVTKAAERLGLSQPAVSGQLARLRDVFGDQLLVPAQRGMTPTAQAVALVSPLRHALDGVRNVVSHGDVFDPATAELTVSIATADAIQYSVLMPFAIELRSRAPGIRLALRNFDPITFEQQAEAGAIDFAITRSDAVSDTMRARSLLEFSWVLIARRNHPVVRRSISLEQFLALDHVIPEPGSVTFAGPTDVALESMGRRRNVVLSVSNLLVVADIVARSDLIAIVPGGMVLDRADRLQILEPPFDIPKFSLAIVWHQRNHTHAGHRWVRDALVESVARNTPHTGMLSE